MIGNLITYNSYDTKELCVGYVMDGYYDEKNKVYMYVIKWYDTNNCVTWDEEALTSLFQKSNIFYTTYEVLKE